MASYMVETCTCAQSRQYSVSCGAPAYLCHLVLPAHAGEEGAKPPHVELFGLATVFGVLEASLASAGCLGDVLGRLGRCWLHPLRGPRRGGTSARPSHRSFLLEHERTEKRNACSLLVCGLLYRSVLARLSPVSWPGATADLGDRRS